VTVFLIALGALVFAISVCLVGPRWKREENEPTARQWDAREQLLDRRKLVTTHGEILERRARRGCKSQKARR